MTHICVGKLTIIGSDNGLSPERRQAIIWTNAGILLIGPLGPNFSKILIEIQTFSLKKLRLKMSSAKCCSFRLGLNMLKMMCCPAIKQLMTNKPVTVFWQHGECVIMMAFPIRHIPIARATMSLSDMINATLSDEIIILVIQLMANDYSAVGSNINHKKKIVVNLYHITTLLMLTRPAVNIAVNQIDI